MKTERKRPNWDMTPYFSAPDGADYRSFRGDLERDLGALRHRVETLAPPSPERRSEWASLLADLERASARFGHLRSYLSCVGAADATDERIQRERSALAPLGAELEKVFVAVKAGFKEAEESELDALFSDERLAPVRYYLERLRRRAEQTMPAELEALAADLAVDGLSAWGRLYDQLSGKLELDFAPPGREPERLPVSMTRSLLEDPDPEVRRAAQLGAAEAWERASDAVAACLNGIAGTRLTLYRRRGVGHFLEPALEGAGIERATLDAMWAAVRERQEVGRRYLRRKARHLGRERLGFQDLLAPIPRPGEARIPWEEATRRVREAFAASYPALAEFAARALEERWIDYEPRAGKRPGGFCSSSHLIGQSRVFMTYNGAMGDVQTLAHELGHAFHNWLMRDQRSWARAYPMTLAETASTFAEQLVIDAALAREGAGGEERLGVLDHQLTKAAAFLLNIPTRFDFEYAVYERRAGGELTVSQLKELMLEAQRRNYGDALAEEELDPWFWASKLHFYITGISFYNFPYTFGYLFSLGIVARARAEGASFLPTYEALLRATGSAPAERVAREHLGVDIQEPDFWHASIDLVEEALERYEAESP